MKQYFLGFDFYNSDVNKFYFGTVYVDLKETELIDLCKQIIKDSFTGICPEDVTIKVTTLNNIET